jgi:uncharacterized protein (DUF433 family)
MSKRMVIDARICGGRPTLEGTRLTCGDIVGVSHEIGLEKFLQIHSYLTANDVAVAIRYAADRKCFDEGVMNPCEECRASRRDADGGESSVWEKARGLLGQLTKL